MNYSLRPGKYSCKLCKERYEACHDTCEKYQTELKAWKDEQEKVRKGRKKYSEYEQYHKTTVTRMKKCVK